MPFWRWIDADSARHGQMAFGAGKKREWKFNGFPLIFRIPAAVRRRLAGNLESDKINSPD
jgi:hypothetical protein